MEKSCVTDCRVGDDETVSKDVIESDADPDFNGADEDFAFTDPLASPAFKWDTKSTNYFIKLYNDRKNKFRNPRIMKKTLWTEMARDMNAAGYKVDDELLDRKLRNMKKTYRTIKDRTTTGKGTVKWEYFDIFEDIFSSDCTDICDPVISPLTRSKICELNMSNSSSCSPASPLHLCEGEPPYKIKRTDPSADRPASQTFKWDTESTKLFVEMYHKRKNKFRDPKIMKKTLWSEMAREMNAAGYNVDRESLDRKLRNMKKTYKTIKDKKITSTDRIKWEYFYVFEDIFSGDSTLNFGPAISADICELTTSNSSSYPPSPHTPYEDLLPTKIENTDTEVDRPDSRTFKWNTESTYFSEMCHEKKNKPLDPTTFTSSPLSPYQEESSHEIKNTDPAKSISSSLYFRQKMLEVQERKAAASEDLNRVLRETNKLLKEHNELLRHFLEARSSGK